MHKLRELFINLIQLYQKFSLLKEIYMNQIFIISI